MIDKSSNKIELFLCRHQHTTAGRSRQADVKLIVNRQTVSPSGMKFPFDPRRYAAKRTCAISAMGQNVAYKMFVAPQRTGSKSE